MDVQLSMRQGTWEKEKPLPLAWPKAEGAGEGCPNMFGVLDAWLKEKPVLGVLCPKLKPVPEEGWPKG